MLCIQVVGADQAADTEHSEKIISTRGCLWASQSLRDSGDTRYGQWPWKHASEGVLPVFSTDDVRNPGLASTSCHFQGKLGGVLQTFDLGYQVDTCPVYTGSFFL